MAGGGSAKQKQQRDKHASAVMKSLGIERTTGRCPVCYSIHSTSGPKSKYQHVCPGGGRRKQAGVHHKAPGPVTKYKRQRGVSKPYVSVMEPVVDIYTKAWRFLGTVPDRGTTGSLTLARERWGGDAHHMVPGLRSVTQD